MLKKVLFRPRSYVSANFWVRNFFFANSASVHTYPVYPAYESVCQSGDFWIRYESGNRVDANSRNVFIQWRHNIEPCSLPGIFKTMPSAMGYRFYTSWTSVSSHNLCTVKPSYDYLTLQLCQTAARHFEASFQVGRTNLDSVNKLNERNSVSRQFCQWNSYWRRLAIKFSHEPKIAVQISWRTESESQYVWTWAN